MNEADEGVGERSAKPLAFMVEPTSRQCASLRRLPEGDYGSFVTRKCCEKYLEQDITSLDLEMS
jgi:hypothetical protein